MLPLVECSVFAGIVLHYKNNRTLIENLEFVPPKNMFTLYCTMLHSNILYHTVVYSILLYCTINCKCTNCPETQIWVLWEFGWPCRGGWNISDRSSSLRIEDSGALEVNIRSITGHEPHCHLISSDPHHVLTSQCEEMKSDPGNFTCWKSFKRSFTGECIYIYIMFRYISETNTYQNQY